MQVDVFEAAKSCLPQTKDDSLAIQEAINGGFIACTPADFLAILDYWQKVGERGF